MSLLEGWKTSQLNVTITVVGSRPSLVNPPNIGVIVALRGGMRAESVCGRASPLLLNAWLSSGRFVLPHLSLPANRLTPQATRCVGSLSLALQSAS